jgi:CRP/FNR family transcriptional regulator
MTTADLTGVKPGSKDCGDCPIRRQAICSRCQHDELLLLDKMKTYRTFQKGEMIAYAGEDMCYVGTLVTGIASISQGLEDGRRQIMGMLLPSDFVGRPGRRTTHYDIVAASEVVMCRFEINAFERLLAESPALGPRLLEMTMDELDAAREWMLLLGRKSAREKIATLICMIATKSRSLSGMTTDGSFEFTMPLTRETMADYLGLTIETVSRQLTALRKDHVIAIKGQRQITIPDFRLLLDETGDDYSGNVLP